MEDALKLQQMKGAVREALPDGAGDFTVTDVAKAALTTVARWPEPQGMAVDLEHAARAADRVAEHYWHRAYGGSPSSSTATITTDVVAADIANAFRSFAELLRTGAEGAAEPNK